MRVSQIQNLTWAGNVLVLGGVVWVGLQFWHEKNAKPAADPDWKKAKTDDVGKQRWPGEPSAFEVIFKTPINGKVPPPPAPPQAVQKIDKTTEFKGKLKYVSGAEFPNAQEVSQAQVSYDGKVLWIQPGDEVASTGFKLIEFRLVPSKAAAASSAAGARKDETKIARMVFRNPDSPDPLVIEQPEPSSQTLVGDAQKLVQTQEETENIKRGRCPEAGPVGRVAIQMPDGDWLITDDEQLWIETWGEKNLLPNLGMKPETDADGNPRGVRVTQLPEPKTPLAPAHGIFVSDVILSINKVPVNSKEEILAYLRGPGKGLTRYDVVVSANGAERTVVFRVPRPGKASRD